jgi:hypothetical protein
MLEKFLQSWPTVVAGVAVLAVVAAFLMKMISLQEFLAAFGVLTGGGLMLSKTFNVSGPPK